MSSKVPFDHLKNSFIDFKKVAFYVYKDSEKDFKDSFDHLKHCFLDFTQVAFLDCQEVVNEFAVPGDFLE